MKTNKHFLSLCTKINNKIAVIITAAMGSMGAVYIVTVIIFVWMAWETFIPNGEDPYPFPFLLLILNILQMILMPLIMVGQNLLGKHGEERAEKEYKTTLLSYKSLEKILLRLDKQDEELLRQTKMLNNLLRENLEYENKE